MTYRLLELHEYEYYDQLVEKALHKTIFQTRTYLESLKVKNWTYEIYGKFADGFLESAFAIQKIPFFNKYIYQISYGMLSFEEEGEMEFFEEMFKKLKKNALLIRFSLNNKSEEIEKRFTFKGQRETLIIDLTPSLEMILKGFSKTHRNCTKKAIKEGVLVKISKDIKDVDAFVNMYQKMTKRKKIEQIDPIFLKEALIQMIEKKLGFFAITSYEDIVYNITYISTVGDCARYLYGASTFDDKKIPPIGQYVHYEVINHLKKNEFLTYDLGGIPSLPIHEDHPSYSVYKFKKGFGGCHQITSYQYQYTKHKILNKLIP